MRQIYWRYVTSARSQWKCPNCVATGRKGGDNSNTPVRTDKLSKISRSADTDSDVSIAEIAVPFAMADDANIFSRFEIILDAKLKSIKCEIVEELKTTIFNELKNDMASLSTEFTQLQSSYSQLQIENDHLKNDLCVLQNRISKSEDQVLELRSQFGKQQQQARINNLEIVGLPQTSTDSPIDFVLRIAKYAGVELSHGDIEFAHRVQPQRTIAGRPKPIVAKLRDRLYKDRILSGLKKKKGICTKDVGIGPEKKIFVNEHLTPENKQLLKSTKNKAKEKAYKYDILRCDRNPVTSTKTKGGGVVMCASKKLHIQHQHEWDCPGVEALWATIPAQSLNVQGNQNIHIGLIYAPPDVLLPARLESISSRLAEIVASHPNDFLILAGDFNLPNVTWSDSGPTIQKRGSLDLQNAFVNFVDLCNISGLKQQNTIKNSKHNTLDLLFSNIDFDVIHCPNPLVSEDVYHPCLEFNLSNLLVRKARQKSISKPNFFKGDYIKINEYLSKINWKVVLVGDSIDRVIEIFYSILNETINNYIPIKAKFNSNFPVWYSKSLTHIVKEKLLKHKRWKEGKNPRDYDEFALLRTRQKNVQKKCYNSYIRRMQSYILKDPKLLFSYTKSLRSNNNGYPTKLTRGDTAYTDETSICSGFSEYFESVFVKPTNTYDPTSLINLTHNESLSKIIFAEDDILRLLKSLKTNKGAGSDGIPPIFLSKCASNLAKPLAIIFNLSINVFCCFPEIWKQALIVPIHKSGSRTK
ncbi:jg1391, partial [Pararge aegeria aegeria]